jgi:hypothetical protein
VLLSFGGLTTRELIMKMERERIKEKVLKMKINLKETYKNLESRRHWGKS